MTSARKSTSVVNCERMKKDSAKAASDRLAVQRASTLSITRAATGVSITATTPLGAATRPAQVAI